MNSSSLFRIFAALLLVPFLAACSGLVEGDNRHLQPLSSQTTAALRNMGSSPGAAMMIRIYKEDSELEVWKQTSDGSFHHFRTYEICTFSGELGPKIREGDRQSPEGFYNISPGLMNPRSNYYLAFNLGYPNKFDRAYGRTGSNLMVHGDCSSRGCYAMTDEQIAEIYALARETLAGGNTTFQVQIYPFRMTAANMAAHHDSENMPYWQNLLTGYLHTEITGRPPEWDVCGREYVFNVRSQSGQPLNAQAACPALVGDTAVLSQVNSQQSSILSDYRVQVANIEQREANAAEAARRQEENRQALEERTEVVNDAMNGIGDSINGFINGLFGGGEPQAAQQVTEEPVASGETSGENSSTGDSSPVVPAPPIRVGFQTGG